MKDLQFKKFNVVQLKDHAYEQLRNAIMSGKFKQGDKLTVRSVARAIGASEAPARAALNRLLTEGALVQIPTSGSMVLPNVTRKDFIDWMTLRGMLEEYATILATPNVTPSVMKKLKKLQKQFKADYQANDVAADLDTNFKFKHILFECSQSDTLVQFIDMLWLRVVPFLRIIPPKSFPDYTLGMEDKLIAFLERGDARAAGKVMRKDLEYTMETFLERAQFDED